MTLPLRLGLEPQPSQEIVAGELHAIVGHLALGSALLAGLGTLGLEQLELAAVARVAQRRAAPRTARAGHGLTRQRAESSVLELARGGVKVTPHPPDPRHPPTPCAARPLYRSEEHTSELQSRSD